jgi:hypothetical protein
MKRSSFLRWVGESWQEKVFGNRRPRHLTLGRGRGAARRLAVEELEDRTLLSVLPPITPTSLQVIGSGNTPASPMTRSILRTK